MAKKNSTIPISDLLQWRRPISATFSLHHSRSPPLSDKSKTLKNPPNSTPNSHSKTLISLSKPSTLIGTVSLPIITHSHSSSSNSTCNHHSCFSFSDSSAWLCCDVLRFDIRMINRKIRVLGWNFIPFKLCGGLLEIIDWEFVDGFNSDCVFFGNEVFGKEKKGKYSVYGVVRSVSPVSFVSNEDLSGFFMVEFLCCDCRLCNSFDKLRLEKNTHDFCMTRYVYFCGVSLSWYPIFLKLLGNVLLLEGLRKKMVYVGKEKEGELMFVSSEMTRLRVAGSKENDGDCLGKNSRAKIKGKGELGSYVGVVSGIYMQGMAVELDEDAWLLLSNGSQCLPHSARVGAILSVRNVHMVNPKFRWGKLLILGACCKTNISIISFSPLETRCGLVSWSKSCLLKFLETLVFPARLWVLLLVQCFRKKFAGVFSEKDILGTKHTEGLVQTYARFILPASAFHSRHNILMEFCKHNVCAAGFKIYFGSLSLAMPFSNLVNNCGRMCVKSLLQIRNGLKILDDCSKIGHPPRENRFSNPAFRRILRSKDIGISLLGNLKICPATGKLQYVDASGSIDAVIPDIPSTWDVDAIYEVYNYSLVLEGTPQMYSQMFEDDLFSCSSLFKNIAIERQAELAVYLHFSWRDVCRRRFGVLQGLNSINSPVQLDPGTFHLLFVAHKYPSQQQLCHGKSQYFAEVIVLPWDLDIAKSEDAALLVNMMQDDSENSYQTGYSSKRRKIYQSNNAESVMRSCGQQIKSVPHKKRKVRDFSSTSPVQVHCTVTGRKMHSQCMDVPGVLSCTQEDGNSDMICSRSSRKVLLEFNSECFYKYKLLQIGGSYIMKHCAEKCFCDSHHLNLESSILITSEFNLWSLSFRFSEAIDCTSSPCNGSSPVSGSTSENSNRFCLHNELVLSPCSNTDYGSFSDFILHVGADANGLLDVISGFLALKGLVTNLSQRSTFVSSIGQPVVHENKVIEFLQNQVMYTENVLPKENLISLQGILVRFENSSDSSDRMAGNRVAHNICQPRSNKDKEGSMLVLTDGHLVKIYGRLSQLNCPAGFGPGAVVTFHRILAHSGQNCFILSPVSFITVNSVREMSSASVNSILPNPEESVVSCLISDLIHSDVCQPRMFRGSIVAVYFVMLERNKSLDKLLSRFHSETPVVNSPLAGFILDDGSSYCCCWADGDQAATFLRLHEQIPKAESASSWWRVKDAVRSRALSTPSNQLHSILKKHERVIVKNHGSIRDILHQELKLSGGTKDHFDSQDENILKYIMLNTCSGPLWNVTSHAMNCDTLGTLAKKLQLEQMTPHPVLRNIWAKQVHQVNPRAQAKALLQDL